MPTRVRDVESYMAQRGPRVRVRPHRIRHWRAENGRWHYSVLAGNHREIDNSEREPKSGYVSKRWALHKAKQALPRDSVYVLELVDV